MYDAGQIIERLPCQRCHIRSIRQSLVFDVKFHAAVFAGDMDFLFCCGFLSAAAFTAVAGFPGSQIAFDIKIIYNGHMKITKENLQ